MVYNFPSWLNCGQCNQQRTLRAKLCEMAPFWMFSLRFMGQLHG